MKYISIKTVILFVVCNITVAHANWSAESITTLKSKSSEYIHLQNSGLTSLWGGVKRKFSNTPQMGSRIQVDITEKFKKKKLEVYLNKSPDKGPLNIFFPGVFGSLDGALVPSMVSLLESFPGHVLVIPNFLSVPYVEAGPIYSESPEEFDIEVAAQIIEKIILKIEDENFTGINLFAESLGSFVAAGVLSKMSNNKKYYNKDLNLTLMWPPANLSLSLKNFDAGISRTKKKYDECGFIENAIKLGYHFLYQDIPMNMSKNFILCMESYMYHFTFVSSIQKTFDAFVKTNKIKNKKIKPSNFDGFFAGYNKSFSKMIKEGAEPLKITYWLKKRNFENTNVRIITSQNDFINIGVNWGKVIEEAYLGKSNLIILPWGGHSGGLAMPVWKEVFKKEFFND